MALTTREVEGIAVTTLNQLANTQTMGFGRIKSMLNATEISSLPTGGVQFRFKGSRKWNGVIISLNANDEYDITFCRFSRMACNDKWHEVNGIQADNLAEVFEHHTGLATHI